MPKADPLPFRLSHSRPNLKEAKIFAIIEVTQTACCDLDHQHPCCYSRFSPSRLRRRSGPKHVQQCHTSAKYTTFMIFLPDGRVLKEPTLLSEEANSSEARAGNYCPRGVANGDVGRESKDVPVLHPREARRKRWSQLEDDHNWKVRIKSRYLKSNYRQRDSLFVIRRSPSKLGRGRMMRPRGNRRASHAFCPERILTKNLHHHHRNVSCRAFSIFLDKVIRGGSC